MSPKTKAFLSILALLALIATRTSGSFGQENGQISLISLGDDVDDNDGGESQFDDDYWTDYCLSSSWTQSPVQISTPLHYLGSFKPFHSKWLN